MIRNSVMAGPAVLRGTLDLIVLQTLGTLGPLDGYGITVRLRKLSGGALSVNAEIFPGCSSSNNAAWSALPGRSRTTSGRREPAPSHPPAAGSSHVTRRNGIARRS